MTVTVTITNSNGNDYTHEWPAKFAVCDDCEGHGTVLHDAIREHAYSAEEFAESFDDEEREQYFKRGGMYDVQCPTCKGARLVTEVDRSGVERLRHGVRLLALWDASEEARRRSDAEYRAEVAAERRMGA